VKKIAQPIPFTFAQLDQARHVCAFFNSEEAEYRLLLPLIRDGFGCGYKAVRVVSVIAFGARADDIWCRNDGAVICVCAVAKFSGDTVIDVMGTDP